MEALRALTAKKAQEVHQLTAGKSFVSKAALEEAKLKQIREEEAREREEKERKRKALQLETKPSDDGLSRLSSDQLDTPTVLSTEEVIRRLRALGEPVTLFGESDFDRMKRLKKVERELGERVREEDQQDVGRNQLVELQRKEKKAKLTEAERSKANVERQQQAEQASTSGAVEDDPVLAAFKKAAAELAERRAEESLSIEDRISKYFRKWVQEWEEDLDKRPEEVKAMPSGRQATLTFKTTQKNFETLYDRLKRRELSDELRTGLWMIVQHIRDRNYLAANDVYLRLAIGNAPWPIGVTSVGIHERSAREKISHVMNSEGGAHIMNDEGTRKYFQAIKRLITQLQRIHPTDPSRCVDFDTRADLGKGVSGSGSAKEALLDAEARGETWRALGLPSAPHFIDGDSTVRIPEKWQNILRRGRSPGADKDGSREGSPAP